MKPVRKIRHQRGAHCETNDKSSVRIEILCDTDLLEQVHERPIDKVPEEKFVAAGDCSRQVTEGQRSSMILSISPAMSASDNNRDHVQSERDGEVLDWSCISLAYLMQEGRSIPSCRGCTKPGT